MNPRLAKELRPLVLPWSVAALGATGHLAGLANSSFANGAFGSFLIGLAGVAFVVGVLVLAAMPIAIELEARTLALLFTQPMDRLRLWKDKLLAAALAIVALGIVHGFASGVTGHGHLSLPLIVLYAAFALAADKAPAAVREEPADLQRFQRRLQDEGVPLAWPASL
jgi:ABC-type transport system involved in multi-copper enzyme maturation permease subunit